LRIQTYLMILNRVLQAKWLSLIFVFSFSSSAFPQDPKDFINVPFLNKLNCDSTYSELKEKVTSGFYQSKPGAWGEFVTGVKENIITKQKKIGLTFDACGGKNGKGYDKELIDFLRSEKIPATLFISGKWIDENFDIFLNLSRDTLFEIENHGLNHRPCSVNGESAYGIRGTSTVEEAFDEIEANALKIKAITGYYPRFYRSATAYIDETSVKIAAELGIKVVSYQVLSGDAVAFNPASVIEQNVLKNIIPGAIVIMHLNHPEWNTCEAMKKIVPKLREEGYTFVKLGGFELTSGKR
jgi:peptidoglycan/xylan/chitin deacetylase (PgdA/CDA1 family)